MGAAKVRVLPSPMQSDFMLSLPSGMKCSWLSDENPYCVASGNAISTVNLSGVLVAPMPHRTWEFLCVDFLAHGETL